MKKIFTFLLSAGFILTNYAQNFQWAKSVGGTGLDQVNSVAIDKQGNTYVTGKFEGTADFDPSGNTANLVSAGMSDIFLAKYDASGNYLWAFSIGSAFQDAGNYITIDASGNVLVTGSFIGPADFDPSAGTAIPAGWNVDDIFIAKYDASGNYIWSITFLGSGYDYGYALATDASCNIYATGRFNKTIDFDPSAGTASVTSANNSVDAFLAKYDSSGSYIWAKNIGGNGGELSYSLAMDDSCNVYITGTFQDTADFDPSASTANLISAGLNDIFVAKYDSSGNFMWANRMGGTGDDFGNSVAADRAGNVLVTGRFSGTAYFDPSDSTANLTSVGSMDIFFARYTASGSYLWANGIGGTGFDNATDISLSPSGNAVYVAGNFFDTVDFDPSANTANLTASATDIFLARYDILGNYLWAKNLGGTNEQNITSVVTDTLNNLYFGGYYASAADFDGNTFTAAGSYDIFIARYKDTLCVSPSIPSIAAADTFICSGNSTMLAITSGTLNDAANWYWYSGDCSVTLMDSGTTIAVSPLTTTAYYAKGAGGCVTSSACDSLVIIVSDTTQNNMTETACNSYTLNGVTYDSTGTYLQILTNAGGCDSLITLNLTINNADTSISQSGAVLSANAAATAYQWIDCNNGNMAINGETGQSFTAAANGSYAVIIMENNCTDTSSCYNITSLGMEDKQNQIATLIYPNPVKDFVTISFGKIYPLKITVTNLYGQVLREVQQKSDNHSIDFSGYSPGVYLLNILTVNQNYTVRIVKQ